MKFKWKPESLIAAHRALLGKALTDATVLIALDAAVKAQGVKMDYATGRAHGRAEAFKEAAAVAERLAPDLPDIADAIRKLAETEEK